MDHPNSVPFEIVRKRGGCADSLPMHMVERRRAWQRVEPHASMRVCSRSLRRRVAECSETSCENVVD